MSDDDQNRSKELAHDRVTGPQPNHRLPLTTRSAFECPHCGAFAQQHWHRLCMEMMPQPPGLNATSAQLLLQQLSRKAPTLSIPKLGAVICDKDTFKLYAEGIYASSCGHCSGIALWNYAMLIYPRHVTGPMPSPDLPDELKKNFEEARLVLNVSPRSAAALCRLLIEKLLVAMNVPGRTLNDRIGALAKSGVPSKLIRSLHSVRLIGNDLVHPGAINESENIQTATTLLEVTNYLVQVLITIPKQTDELLKMIPESKLSAIGGHDPDVNTTD